MFKKTLFCLAFSALLAPQSIFADSPHPSKTTKYVVQKGDSLWKISKNTWGQGGKWAVLFATNQEKIKNPNLIFTGQKLTIPATISKEEMEKAAQLVAETLPVASVETHKKSHKTTPQENPASSQPAETKPETSETAPVKQAPAPITEAQPAPLPESSGHTVLWIILGIILVLGGVGFFMYKSMQTPPQQQPRPLSSFPQASQPPPARTYPAPSSPPSSTAPTASNVTPIRPVVTPSNPPAAIPVSSSPSSTISGIPINRPSQPAASPTTPPKPVDAEAESLIQQGRYMEAAKVYRNILEKDPGNVEIGKKLVQVEEKMRLKADNATPVQAASSPSEPKQPDLPMSSGTVTSVSNSSVQNPQPSTPPATSPQQAESKSSVDNGANPPGQGTKPI